MHMVQILWCFGVLKFKYVGGNCGTTVTVDLQLHFGCTKMLHTLIGIGSASLVIAVAVPRYWVIQRSWFARVNALCNLSAKKSREVAAHFRADF